MYAAVLNAIYDRLAAVVGVTSLLANGASSLYDWVPQELADNDAAFPLVIMGSVSSDEFDADGRLGAHVRVSINTFSRYRGKKEAAEVAAAITTALHRYDALSVSGYNVVDVFRDGADSINIDPDGLTYQVNQTFRVTVTSAA